MGIFFQIVIKESLEALKLLKKNLTSLKAEKRIVALIILKQDSLLIQQKLADLLNVHRRTVGNWLLQYRKNGIVDYLPKEHRNKSSKIITTEIHNPLEKNYLIQKIQCWITGMHSYGYGNNSE